MASAADGLIDADPKVGRLRGKRCERVRRASCEANRSGAATINPISARNAAASNTNLRDDGRPSLTRMGHYVAACLGLATGPSGRVGSGFPVSAEGKRWARCTHGDGLTIYDA